MPNGHKIAVILSQTGEESHNRVEYKYYAILRLRPQDDVFNLFTKTDIIAKIEV